MPHRLGEGYDDKIRARRHFEVWDSTSRLHECNTGNHWGAPPGVILGGERNRLVRAIHELPIKAAMNRCTRRFGFPDLGSSTCEKEEYRQPY